MSNVRFKVQAKGLAEEKKVIEFAREVLGLTVTDSTEHEDRMLDIDCWADGVAVSIKAEHNGVAYGNIYFELAQHLTEFKDCPVSTDMLDKRDLNQTDVDALVAVGSWEPSWWTTGKADVYWILQGEVLKVYRKIDVQRYVAAKGWRHCKGLSFKRKSYLGGRYRYVNAICGYLNISDIPHVSYHMPCDLPDDLPTDLN